MTKLDELQDKINDLVGDDYPEFIVIVFRRDSTVGDIIKSWRGY